jgi:hypothetical protein
MKGKTNNPFGRPKGVPNKITQLRRDFIQDLLDTQKPKIENELVKLEGKDYLTVITGLMEFVMPKLQRTELKSDISGATVILNLPPGMALDLPSNTDGEDEQL